MNRRTGALPLHGAPPHAAAPAVAVVAVAAVVVAAALAGCPRHDGPTSEATVYFRGDAVGRVADTLEHRSLARSETLSGAGDVILLSATLDEHGFVSAADYTHGTSKVRAVHLRAGAVDDDRGDTSAVRRPAVLIDLLRYVQPPSPIDVALVDLSSGEIIDGRVERRGAEVVALDAHGGVVARCNVEGMRTGPGAFFEGDAPPSLDTAPVEVALVGASVHALRLVGVDDVVASMKLDGPGQRHDAPGAVVTFDAAHDDAAAPGEADARPGLFLESGAADVVAFAKKNAGGHEALADAVSLAEAVHGLVDPKKSDVPPSAHNMLEQGGDCDGAAALVVASLRALGHPARPVVGYRLVAGKLVPHAWAEVFAAGKWVPVDATVPKVGVDAEHLRLFEGLGGALTMGRVLGKLRVEPVL